MKRLIDWRQREMDRVIKFQIYCQMKEGLRKYAVTGIEYKRYGEREISKVHVGDMAINGEYLKDGLAHLVQFTGLTDRNGVEIYEGDIVDYGADYSVVRYQDGCFWSRLGQYQLYNHNKNDIEVIGNIYEHPHLLEGVK